MKSCSWWAMALALSVLTCAGCALFGSSRPEMAIVRITPAGLWVDGKPASMESLVEDLAAVLQRRQTRCVQLESDPAIEREVTEEILESIYRATDQITVSGERSVVTRVLGAGSK